MADRKLTFDIEANSDAARRALADLRREFNQTLAELKRQQGDIALFKAAQQDAAKLERQIKALGKAGGDTSALTAALAAQRAALAQQSAALTAAGVNTQALSSEQARLRIELEKASRAFNQQSAAAIASANAAEAAASAERAQLASARQRVAAIESERQARIAYGNQVLASLRAQAAAQDQQAAAERRARADADAAARAAAANARVRTAQQQQAALDAQAAARSQLAARAIAERGEIAVKQSRLLAAAQTQAAVSAQKLAADQVKAAAATQSSAAAAASSRAQMLSYAAALVSVGAAIKGINAITTAGTQLQALNSSLLFSTGSAESAADAYAFVKAEAERLGLPLQVLGKEFSQLAAAANGTALEGEATRKIFTSVASAARVMGLQGYQVERALLAIQQIMSKGNVQAEELRGQLGEQIPGAFNIAARAMGVTTAELNNMLKAGEVLSEDFLPKFAAELQRTVDPAVPAATKTYAAEIERLRNQITLFLQEVGKSGALEAISAQVVIVTQKLREMSDSGELQPAIEQLVETLSLLARGLAELAEFVAKNSQTLLTLASAFAIVKAAQIGLGIGQTVADFIKMERAASGAAAGIAGIGKALKGFAVLAVVGFTVDKLVELVAAIKEANQVEEDMAKARGERNAEADIAIINNADYAKAVVKGAAEIEAATEREREAYAKTLKGALAYYEALKQRALRGVGAADAIPQAALDAQQQIRIYSDALREFDGISDARVKLEADQAAAIKKIKEQETKNIKLAIDAQIEEVKRARGELRKEIDESEKIASRTIEFSRQLASAGKAESAPSLLDVQSGTTQVKSLLAKGAKDEALAQIEEVRKAMLELRRNGEAELFLKPFERELAQLAEQAGQQGITAAEENVQEQERKLLTLQSLAKQIETLNINADVSAADKAMRDLHAKTQAFYDANPLIVKVVTQRQDDIAAGIEKAPKKAGGGLLRGPGSGTSDSILMWGSNGEYMLRAAAVRSLGRARLDYMNRYGRIPGFADGGAIGEAVSRLPAPLASGVGSRRVLNLTLPGVGSFETQADEAVANALERALRAAALKSGRRT